GKRARDLNAGFAAVADPSLYDELKSALAGSGIAAGAGEEAVVEAAQRPADWVMGAITGAAGLRPTLAAAERGATVALANHETLVCPRNLPPPPPAARRGPRRRGGAGRFRAQCELPVAGGRDPRERPPHHPDGLGRPVPDLDDRRDPRRDARAGAAPPELVDGSEGHDRFRHADEQG